VPRRLFPLVDVLIGTPDSGPRYGTPALLPHGVTIRLTADEAKTVPVDCRARNADGSVGAAISSVVVVGAAIPTFYGPDDSTTVAVWGSVADGPAFPLYSRPETQTAAVTRPSSVPASQALAYSFNGSKAAYNVKPSNTRRLTAAIARSAFTLQSIAAIGDSLTVGFGTPVAELNLYSYPSWLARRVLPTRLGTPQSGTGVVSLFNNYGDPRVATSGSGLAFGAPHFALQANAAGNVVTFTSDVPGTVAEVWSFGGSSPFTIAVDGAIPAAGAVSFLSPGPASATYNASTGTVTPNGQSAVLRVIVSGLANTTHAVRWTSTAAAGFVEAFRVGNPTGLEVSRMAVAGATMQTAGGGYSWQDTDFFSYAGIMLASNPAAVLVGIGGNDANQNLSIDTYRTQLQAFLLRIRAAGADPIIVAESPFDVSGGVNPARWASFVAAQYVVADAVDCPLIDQAHAFGSYAESTTLGLTIADGLHLNPSGYMRYADVIGRALAS